MIHLRLLGGVELSTRDAGDDRRLAVAPKQLALLAYLAVASARETAVCRDVLLALFWPELSTERARGALRQLLFQLRRALGPRALHADRETIFLAHDALSSDVQVFERRLAAGDRAGAMDVYCGPLLEGFFVDGVSAALEEWIETERRRLNGKAFLAARELADEAERSGNGIAAAQWARAAVTLAPDNEIAVRRFIEILDAFGDRSGALRVAEDFARRISAEFEATPSAETQALIAAVRARGPLPERTTTDAVPKIDRATAAIPVGPVAHSPPAVREAKPRRVLLAVFALFIAAVGGAALLITRSGRGATVDTGDTSAMSPPITISSPVARGLYAEGLRRYNSIDMRESARLFGAALAEDSSCAMCAYYAAQADASFDEPAGDRMFQLAMRLSDRVSEAERLFIHFQWADITNSVSRSAAAESLVSRYPNWAEAQTAAAQAAKMSGNWLAAADHIRRVLASAPPRDSTSGARCPLCAAKLELYDTYEAADSLPAALRLAQTWVQAEPHSRRAWLQLSHALAESGRYDEARAAIDSSTRYAMGTEDDVIEHAQIEIRAGNFAVADRLLTTLSQTGNANSQNDALWFFVISLRTQGRLHEALRVVEGPLRRASASSTQGLGNNVLAEGEVLLELGEYRRAAATFASVAWPVDSFARTVVGRVARQHVWALTHVGTAVAAEGDTTALARLADTIEVWGKRSGFERDRRLHYYLRGLLWMARSRPESAIVAFRRSMISETEGFSRTNLELSRCLLALGRPREAIPVLEHSLRGTLEAGNLYATRTELQDELAQAYDAAGERDSAAVNYRRVVEAWHAADPQFRTRVASARAKLAVDERRLAGGR